MKIVEKKQIRNAGPNQIFSHVNTRHFMASLQSSQEYLKVPCVIVRSSMSTPHSGDAPPLIQFDFKTKTMPVKRSRIYFPVLTSSFRFPSPPEMIFLSSL